MAFTSMSKSSIHRYWIVSGLVAVVAFALIAVSLFWQADGLAGTGSNGILNNVIVLFAAGGVVVARGLIVRRRH